MYFLNIISNNNLFNNSARVETMTEFAYSLLLKAKHLPLHNLNRSGVALYGNDSYKIDTVAGVFQIYLITAVKHTLAYHSSGSIIDGIGRQLFCGFYIDDTRCRVWIYIKRQCVKIIGAQPRTALAVCQFSYKKVAFAGR